jgi:hypothetical protein
MRDIGWNVVRLAAPADAMLEKYAAALAAEEAAIAADDLPLLRRVLVARLQPAARVDVAAAVMVLAGSFKLGSHIEDPEIFVSGMIEELSAYPADILEAAVRGARRSLKALPSIAEMVALCEGLVEERRAQLAALERIEAKLRSKEVRS